MLPLLRGNDDLKELIFENRNKAYGAYVIRSGYHQTLSRALIITLSSSSFFILLLLFGQKVLNRKLKADVISTEPHSMIDVEVVQSQLKIETKPPGQSVQQIRSLENNYHVVETIKPLATVNNHVQPVETGLETGTGTPVLALNPNTLSTGSPAATGIPAAIEFAMVDVAPEFPGGLEKFYRYLLNELKYTSQAKEENLSGRFFASFIIGPDGKINSVEMLKAIGYGMDERVIRILNESPLWTPGYLHGQPVSTILRLPINFQLLQ